MFDEVGNDSVMKQACFVYTVKGTSSSGHQNLVLTLWVVEQYTLKYIMFKLSFRLCGLQENHHGIVS